MSQKPGLPMEVVSRWNGFNLVEMFILPTDPRWQDMTLSPRGRFQREHFFWIRELGFNFVRLPLSYHYWTNPEQDPFAIDGSKLGPIDSAVEWAREAGLHLSLCFHQAPGYCINEIHPYEGMVCEPFSLWKDASARECFAHHWSYFSKRYREVSPELLSFDLVNEPARCTREEHEAVIRLAVAAIREIDPERPIVIDGFDVGRLPCPELADMGLIQSCRGYQPLGISHHDAWWAGSPSKAPSWPFQDEEGLSWDREALREQFEPWAEIKASGVPVHCGEMGGYSRTPHAVKLAWLSDLIDILDELDIGCALWNFRGSFGVLNNDHLDARYRDFHGCQLDEELLKLLQKRL